MLVRLPNWIGDVVMATPLLRALRKALPDAALVAAGPGHARALLEGLPHLDDCLVLPPRAGLGAVAANARVVAAADCDAALLLTNSFSSALVAWRAGIGERVGYREGGRGLLLSSGPRHPREAGRHRMPTPMVDYYARLLRWVGVPADGHRTELVTSAADETEADAWLQRAGLDGEGGPLVGVHPGSSFGPSKLWYPERFAAVLDRLAETDGARGVVFCGPTERDLARAIAAAASTPVATAADDPMSLGTLKAVIRRLTLLITTDTGPRHLAPPFDVPSVVLMGSTDPRFTNTNLHDSLVLREDVHCSPCQLKVCPIDHRCMTRLEPSRVVAAARRLLPG